VEPGTRDGVLWNPLLRIELRHNLRRLSGKYAAIAWQAYAASETSQRLKLGIQRLSIFGMGDELSARHASNSAAAPGILFTLPPPTRPRRSVHHLRRRPGGTGPRCRPDTGSAFK